MKVGQLVAIKTVQIKGRMNTEQKGMGRIAALRVLNPRLTSHNQSIVPTMPINSHLINFPAGYKN